ncbi:hypothetical protein RUM43_009206 [Polyplax serrata]|uniref:Calpain catalytic domain-containing protein n=1 Tax=Polyplax serrata TaxID=468196 RepID=A0AAN8PW17_POLSC
MSYNYIYWLLMAYTQDELGQRTEFGLKRGQAYHITSIKKIHLGDMKIRNLFKGREKVAMVRLRDTGVKKSVENSPNKSITSSTECDGYAYSTSHLTKLLSKNPVWAKMRESEKERLGLHTDYDGEFWMPFEDFVVNLEELAIVRLFNNNLFARGRRWYESSVRGAWTIGDRGSLSDRSGGGNTNSETFLRNPQYLFQVDNEEEELTFQMLQWDGVEPATPLSNAQNLRPRHCTLLIGFTIIKVETNRKYRLHKIMSFCQLLVSLDHQRKRELYYRGFFPKGRYLLVPTTYKPGAEGNFLIRLFSQGDVKLWEIQRDVPNRSHTFSCLSSPAIWVTVISVKGAVGLGSARNVYCLLKCENQKVKSQISKSDKEIEWSDVFVFYRKYPERPIVVKVYSHNMFLRDKFIGWTELPASVNHSSSQLEATLLRKDNNLIENAIIKLEVLTEDNLMAI